MNEAQLVIPSARPSATESSSRMNSSIWATTSSVRSIEVPIGISNSALKKARSEGGKKRTGTKRKPAMANAKVPTMPARKSVRCLRVDVSQPR